MKRLLGLNWELIAGILAAVVALILHFLHIAETDVLLPIVLVLLALLLIRDFRRENQEDRLVASAGRAEVALREIMSALTPPEVILVGPSELRSASEQFSGSVRGEVVWFNVCLLMFRPQQTFDMLLRPIIENPRVSSVRFISRHSEKELWQTELVPKIAACSGGSKVKEPHWHELEKESVSFILAETSPDGKEEALVSFWQEPFMSRVLGKQIPRYVFHVQAHSGLVERLKEVERSHRLHL